MSEKTFKIIGEDLSDGYHTFDELYEHRHMLFLCLVKFEVLVDSFVVYDHFEGWDLIASRTDEGAQISYHVPNRLRPLYKQLPSKPDNPQYDGHTSKAVIARLEALLL